MTTRNLLRTTLLSAVAGLTFAGATSAQSILFLAEDVPTGLNVDGPSAALPTSQTAMDNLMEPLVGYPKSGELSEGGIELLDFSTFEGRLAESWSYDDATMTWTFNLRQGVMGCNGAEFTADDVVYTFERAIAVAGQGATAWFLSNVASIANFTPAVFADETARDLAGAVKKIDDYTVTITQSEPNALLLPVLTVFALNIYDKELMEANSTEDDPWAHEYVNNTDIPSFGPYCNGGWTKNQEFIFDANPDYYRGAPEIERVVMRRVPQSSNRVVILRTGQAQLVQGLTPREYDSLRGANGIEVFSVTGNLGLNVSMNHAVAPFDDPLVRKAVAYATPYQQIIDSAYFGQAEKWTTTVPSSYPGAIATEIQYDFDPEKAKELLAEAGYPNGEGLEQFGDALNLSYVAEKESILGPVANIMQSALREVGFPVALDPIPQSQYGDRSLIKRDLPFSLNDHDKPIGVDSGYAIALFFNSKENGGVSNAMNYANEWVDSTWNAARVETDSAKRDEMLAEIQEVLMDELAWLPVVEYNTQFAGSDKLGGITYEADGSIRFFDLTLAE